MSPGPCKKGLLSEFSSKTFFNNNQKYASKVARGDQQMAQIRGRGQSGQCLWDKMSEWHHTGGETGHTLLSIPPQPSEIWLQHPKNYKAALMKKEITIFF